MSALYPSLPHYALCHVCDRITWFQGCTSDHRAICSRCGALEQREHTHRD